MKSVLASLSLANLCLVRIWVELLGDHIEPPPTIWYAAALLNLVLLTALIWAVARWGGALGRSLLALAGFALLAKEFTLSAGHDDAAWKGSLATVVESGLRRGWLWPAALILLGMLGWLVWRTQLRWIAPVLVMLSPIVFVTAGQASWKVIRPGRASASAPRPGLPSAPLNAGPRIVVILFDELDERLAFTARPSGLRLPALDAFRQQSVVFRQAFSPSDGTQVSVPLILGRVFERSSLGGHRAGIAGWYIPYCQKYGAFVESCQAWPMDRQLNSYGSGLFQVCRNQLRSFFESSLYSLFGQSLSVEAHVRTVLEMEEAAARLAARPDLDLVFLHLPTPHTPFIFNTERRDLSARNQNAQGYFANLELADRIFSRIQAQLMAGGLWTRTHVLVTGDHGFRQAHRFGYPKETLHVPVMWKPAGQVAPRTVQQRFETRGLGSLVSRLLNNEAAETLLAGYP